MQFSAHKFVIKSSNWFVLSDFPNNVPYLKFEGIEPNANIIQHLRTFVLVYNMHVSNGRISWKRIKLIRLEFITLFFYNI